MTSRLAVLVTPRSGPPYQELLYRGVEASGVSVSYTDGPTPSQTINILLSPALLAWFRLRGRRILHVHWVFQFSLPWARRRRWARSVMEWWFGRYLQMAHLLGYRIVWTAHDLLPHEPVFADDVRARNLLISRASAVIALSEVTASELRELNTRTVFVIPMGSYASPYPTAYSREESRSSFGFGEHDLVVSLIGRVEEYKGADLLLQAAAFLPIESKIRILLAGLCIDDSYRDKLYALAAGLGHRAVLDFRWIPDDDLARYLQATDFAVFPFREITNSGSIMLAQSFGKPVIIPDLQTLSDLPRVTAVRFQHGVESLATALGQAADLSDADYDNMSAAALAWSRRSQWPDIADATIEVYKSVLTRNDEHGT